MAPTNDWHSIIAAKSHHLPPDAARQLREIGFIIMPGPAIQGGCEQISDAYDHAVATADPADVHIGRTRSSTSSMRRYGIAMVQTGRPGHGVRYKLTLSHERLKHRRTTIPGACVRRLCNV